MYYDVFIVTFTILYIVSSFFITVFVYCKLRVQYLASTPTDSVGDWCSESEGQRTHEHYTCTICIY